MNLELKHLGQILAIGGLTIFGIFHLISLINPSWKPKTPFLSEDGHKIHESAMILALVFAAGILVDNLPKIITVDRWQSTPFYDLLDKDKQLLLKSLFEVQKHGKGFIVFKPTPLFYDVHNAKDKDESIKSYITEVTNLIDRNEKEKYLYEITNEDDIKNLEKNVRGMYYIAKNLVLGVTQLSGFVVKNSNESAEM